MQFHKAYDEDSLDDVRAMEASKRIEGDERSDDGVMGGQ